MSQFSPEPPIQPWTKCVICCHSAKGHDGLVDIIDNNGASVDVWYFTHASGKRNANPFAARKMSTDFRSQRSIGSEPRSECSDPTTKALRGTFDSCCNWLFRTLLRRAKFARLKEPRLAFHGHAGIIAHTSRFAQVKRL